ncbi:MAG: FlgD immunoglobulin-like domain containing protein [Fibrobacterota bacterium]
MKTTLMGISILLLAVLAASSQFHFNNYLTENDVGDRNDLNMFNRPSVAGTLQFTTDNGSGHDINVSFCPGEYAFGNHRRVGYYLNHGIQEFAAMRQSDKVFSAWLWGHKLTLGRTTGLRAVAGAAVVSILLPPSEDTEPVWDTTGHPVTYETLALLSGSTDTGRYEGLDNGNNLWLYGALDSALAVTRAFNVTNAVKYIMDHSNQDSLGILVMSDSGTGAIGIPAEENFVTGVGYGLVLTILYNDGLDAAAVPVHAPAAFSLAMHGPNPCVNGTVFSVMLPASSRAILGLYTLQGKRVRTLAEGLAAGSHSVAWDGKDASGKPIPNGMYVCRLMAGARTLVKKVVVAR